MNLGAEDTHPPRCLGPWAVGKLIGQGAFSGVYEAEEKNSGEETKEWVLKVAKVPAETQHQRKKRKTKRQKEAEASSKLLFWEYQVYMNFLRDIPCVPRRPKRRNIYGEQDGWRYLALQRLGKTLKQSVMESGRKYSPRKAFQVAQELLKGFAMIHASGILFRDVKPENFMYGTGNDMRKLFFVDFGASFKYVLHSGKHMDTGAGIAGTPLFMSVSAHLNEPPSRRDDLMSLGYMLCWMLEGHLPWEKAETAEQVLQIKQKTSFSDLCSRLDGCTRKCMEKYFSIIIGLSIFEEPDYSTLRKVFENSDLARTHVKTQRAVKQESAHCASNANVKRKAQVLATIGKTSSAEEVHQKEKPLKILREKQQQNSLRTRAARVRRRAEVESSLNASDTSLNTTQKALLGATEKHSQADSPMLF